MKKFYISLLALVGYFAQAQDFNIISNPKYGQIKYAQYKAGNSPKIYAQTIGNHIVSSNDNGQTWQIVHKDSAPKIDLFRYNTEKDHFLYVTKNNQSIELKIYEASTGFLVQNWTIAYDDINGNNPQVLGYDILDSDYSKIAVHIRVEMEGEIHHQIIYSADSALNWNLIYDHQENEWGIPTEVKFDPNDNSKLYLAFEKNEDLPESGGIRLTEDGGQTFDWLVNDLSVRHFSFNPENSQIWLSTTENTEEGTFSYVFKKDEEINSWEEVPLNWENPGLVDYIYFDSTNNRLFFLEENEIAQSEDGGNSFDIKTFPLNETTPNRIKNPSFISVNPANPSNFIVQSDFYAVATQNNGNNFQRVVVPFAKIDGNVSYVEFMYPLTGLLAYETRNGSHHLQVGDTSPYEIDVDPFYVNEERTPNRFIEDIMSEGSMFNLKKTDQGYTLYSLNSLGGVHIPFAHTEKNELTAVDYINDEQNKFMYASFYSTETQTAELVRIEYDNLENPTVEYFQLPNSNEKIKGIYKYRQDFNTIILLFETLVYKSIDNGQTWELVMDGITEPFEWQKFNNLTFNYFTPNQIIMSTNYGIFKSDDLGENWYKIFDQPTAKIYSSKFEPNKLVGIHSNMVITTSTDNGETWNEYYEYMSIYPSNEEHFSSIIIHDEFAKIAIATQDIGVIYIRIPMPTTVLDVNDPILDESDFQIYPNPTSDFIHLNSAKNVDVVEIFNLSGQSIYKGKDTKINVRNIDPGVYILKARLDNGKIISKKFIKK
jgi:xyloglucan-specific exo-beta-1,4-glucanase